MGKRRIGLASAHLAVFPALLAINLFANDPALAQPRPHANLQNHSAHHSAPRPVHAARPHRHRPTAYFGGAGRATGEVRIVQTIVYRQEAPRRLPGETIGFGELPVVAGIARSPVAPPTIYRIGGSRTGMDDRPGARVITPGDVEPRPVTRRRGALANEHASLAPRIIVIRPE